MRKANQSGVALVVALIALVFITIAGLATMDDLLTQSNTVRNEQFRQRVFYAASSELNAIIGEVNLNTSADSDVLIEQLLDTRDASGDYLLDRSAHLTSTPTVDLRDVAITARRNDLLGCSGESIGKVKVLAGAIDATAQLDDEKPNRGIYSHQRQRFVYCWP